MRNNALDFMRTNHISGISTKELALYSQWCSIDSVEDRQALHRALLGMGARLREKRYLTATGTHSGHFYMGIFWNFETGPDDLFTQLFKLDSNLFFEVRKFI